MQISPFSLRQGRVYILAIGLLLCWLVGKCSLLFGRGGCATPWASLGGYSPKALRASSQTIPLPNGRGGMGKPEA